MMSGPLVIAVSMSLRCFAASNAALVVATTSMPKRVNSSVAPAVTAFTKSDWSCQSIAAVWLPARTASSLAAGTTIDEEGVALSPFGPIV